MPLQPSRRDSAGPISVIRHHQSSLRGRDPGYLDGRFATPQPLVPGPSQLVGGDEGGGEGDDSAVIGEDGDRYTVTSLTNPPPWTLSYTPVAETIVVRWHADAEAGVEWKRGEHYTIDDDDNVITITAEALATAKAHVGDVFSAQYLRLDGEQDAPSDSPLTTTGLVLVGSSGPVNNPSSVNIAALGAQVGDLIVVGAATIHSTGAPGNGFCIDPRVVEVVDFGVDGGFGGASIGIATDLTPVLFSQVVPPYRLEACVAIFRAPAYFKNVIASGGSGGPSQSMGVGQPDCTAAVMVFLTANRNGLDYQLLSYPAGWVVASTPSNGTSICSAGILYWPPDGTSTPPGGSVTYDAYNEPTGQNACLAVIGVQGEEL